MSSRVPPEDVFGRQNADKERMSRGVDDALRLGGDQYADLARRVTEMEAIALSQAGIIATQDAQIAFLNSQTVNQSKGTGTSYTGPNTLVTWQAFNATWDCSVAVTTAASGQIVIQGSMSIASGGFTGLLGIEIVGVVGPAYPSEFSAWASVGTASRGLVASLAPNTAYTIRLRRGIDGSASGTVTWGYQSLIVTKLA